MFELEIKMKIDKLDEDCEPYDYDKYRWSLLELFQVHINLRILLEVCRNVVLLHLVKIPHKHPSPLNFTVDYDYRVILKQF